MDDALTTYYRRVLEYREKLTLDQLQDAYRDHWTRELAAETANRGIRRDDELDEPGAFRIGLAAVALTLSELVPLIGRPVSVQRELEYAIAIGLEGLSRVAGRLSSMSVVGGWDRAVRGVIYGAVWMSSAVPGSCRVRRVVENGVGSWTVIGPDRRPVAPVEAFLRWLTDIERSPNTVRAYADDLCQFWEFLELRGYEWAELGIEELGDFTGWLAQPGGERGRARRR